MKLTRSELRKKAARFVGFQNQDGQAFELDAYIKKAFGPIDYSSFELIGLAPSAL